MEKPTEIVERMSYLEEVINKQQAKIDDMLEQQRRITEWIENTKTEIVMLTNDLNELKLSVNEIKRKKSKKSEDSKRIELVRNLAYECFCELGDDGIELFDGCIANEVFPRVQDFARKQDIKIERTQGNVRICATVACDFYGLKKAGKRLVMQ